MADKIINEINKYSSFRFCEEQNRIINLKSREDTNIDEFLDIQYLLDQSKVIHRFENNFEIQIIK